MTRLAIAHDWMVGWTGSERCVDELVRAYPTARVLTTVVRREVLPATLHRAEPSFLQRLPGATSHHEWLLPLMPLAWRTRRPVRDADVVLSSSHACSKAVRAEPGIPHVCYCYTPMRYAWRFADEQARFPRGLRTASRASMIGFRAWDRRTARRVDRFVAISTGIREWIRRAYGRSADVVAPPVRTDFFTPGDTRGGAFLYVGRLVGYKRPDLVVDAFRGTPYRLDVVGAGNVAPEVRARAGGNVRFLGHVDEEELRTLMRRARALVHPADEDFGIAMAEAQACGTPVIGLARGGARDIVRDGRTGWLIEDQRVETIRRALRRAADEPLDPDEIRRNALRFSTAAFREGMTEVIEEAAHGGGRR